MRPRNRLALSFASLAFFAQLSSPACGAAITWDITPGTVGTGDGSVTGGAGTWNTTNGNWTTDAGATNIAWVNANNDIAVFGGTAGTVTLGTGITVGGLTFNTAGYTITGGTLTLGAITNTVAANTNATISSILAGTGSSLVKTGTGSLALNATNTFSGGLVISAGTVTTNNVSGAGTGTVTLGDANTGSSDVAFLWTPTANTQTFARGIVVSSLGTGTVTLGTGTNTFTAQTYSGAVQLNRATTLQSGTTDRLTFTGGISGNVGTLTISSSGAGRVVFDSTANSFVGDLVITSGSRLQLGVANAAGNYIPDAANVTVNGILNLSYTAGGNETIAGLNGTGTVGINSGITNTLTVGAYNSSGTYGGTLTGAANLGLTKVGSGTQVLNGSASNSYTAATKVNGGILQLDFANMATPTNLISNSSALSLGGGTLSIKGKSSGSTAQTFNGTTVTAGGGQILVTPNGGTDTTVTLGALTTTAAGGSLLVGKTPGDSSTGTVTLTTSTNKDATGIYGGRVVFSNGTANTGYDWATTASGASPYTLSAYSGYTAMATSGTDTANSRITAGTSLAGALTTNSLKVENPAASQTLSLGANLMTLTNGGLLITGTNAFTISGTTGATRLTAGNGSGSYDLVVHQYNSGGATISAVIGDNGANAVNLVKAGTGTLTLSGTNTYTGKTYINSGILSIAADSGLGTAPGAVVADQITISGGMLRTTSSFTLSTNRGITLGAAGGTISVNNSGGTLTYAGTISGSGALTMTGASNTSGLLLTTAQTYTGGTFINSGRIQLNATAATLGTGDIVIDGSSSSAGELWINAGVTLANRIFLKGVGSESRGVIRISSTVATTLSGPIVLQANSTISNSSAGATTLSGQISGAYNLSLNTGTAAASGASYILSGGNTYSGGTTIGNGSVRIANGAATNAFGTGTITFSGSATIANGTSASATAQTISNAITINSGATASFDAGYNDLTLAGNIGGAGNLARTSSGTLILTGTNTYSGTTNAGTSGTLLATTTASLSGYNVSGKVSAGAGGTLAMSVGGAGQWTQTDINTLLANATLDAASNFGLNTSGGDFSYDLSGLTGTRGLTKYGSNTLTLTGTRAYTGTTTIAGGILAVGATGLPTGGAVAFIGTSTLDVGSLNPTIGSLSLADGVTATVTGTGGNALTVNGASNFDLSVNASGTSRTLNLAAMSSFTYSAAANNFDVGGASGTGVASGAASNTLTLASGTNTITALNFRIGHSGHSGSGVITSTVNLGHDNTINADTMEIGNGKVNGVVQFAAGLASAPTLTLRGTDGTSRVNSLVIGSNSSSVSNDTGKLDMTTGTTASSLDALVNNLVIGQGTSTANNSATGTVLMGLGTLDVTTLTIGQKVAANTGTGAATGTFTVTGGTVKVGSLVLGDRNVTAAAGGNISGTFNLNGGATLAAQNIQAGSDGTAPTGTMTRAFNWNDGTIRNYDAATDLTVSTNLTLAATGNHTFQIDTGRTATVSSVISEAASGATLTKTGSGTLVFTGSNTYSGTTTISTGTLQVGNGGTTGTLGSGAVTNNATLTFNRSNTLAVSNDISGSGSITHTGSGTVTMTGINSYTGTTTVNGGGTLRINGNSSAATGQMTVASGSTAGGNGIYGGALNVSGTLSPGASVESFSAGATTMNDGSTLQHEFDSSVATSAGSDLLVVNGDLTLSGVVTLTLTDLATLAPAAPFAEGTVFALVNYTGTWNGGYFTFSGDTLTEGEQFHALDNDWVINYQNSTGGQNFTGDYVPGQFVTLTVVPEPGVVMPGVIGLSILMLRRRRN
ncbi:autotransporter-associated beta strand repeat-containing protein [Luteolibacter ambystomatis]|uniref:Autotransporter-associated beta strand repeat-containing protein n=1 Tax=Luteolibacter ambystomatis TaxID=2824561 RepID=A0A975G8L4_9BACT|nr:autotransporter-associated beta strand repeat-containing protein [Luteolibacter ambystomatis]QUE51342.1 autotransporter-associated beta strand repeat-containing protein [Luteolibacter ambystomatis]